MIRIHKRKEDTLLKVERLQYEKGEKANAFENLKSLNGIKCVEFELQIVKN